MLGGEKPEIGTGDDAGGEAGADDFGDVTCDAAVVGAALRLAPSGGPDPQALSTTHANASATAVRGRREVAILDTEPVTTSTSYGRRTASDGCVTFQAAGW